LGGGQTTENSTSKMFTYMGVLQIHFSTVFAGHDVGLRQVEEDVWLVSFMDYDMAYFDMESHKVSALENPFGPKVLGM